MCFVLSGDDDRAGTTGTVKLRASKVITLSRSTAKYCSFCKYVLHNKVYFKLTFEQADNHVNKQMGHTKDK